MYQVSPDIGYQNGGGGLGSGFEGNAPPAEPEPESRGTGIKEDG